VRWFSLHNIGTPSKLLLREISMLSNRHVDYLF
jgi:hypothetical protein